MGLTLAKLREQDMVTRSSGDQDPEILAISQVYSALRSLNGEAQQRVLEYVARKLGLVIGPGGKPDELDGEPEEAASRVREEPDSASSSDDELEGLSPAARKWMKRSGFSSEKLSHLFSLGVDEIDLVANKVPGKS